MFGKKLIGTIGAVAAAAAVATSAAQAVVPGDNGLIVFSSNRDGNYEIYVMNANGSRLRKVTNHPEKDDFPVWHPDGKKILSVSERQGKFDLYLHDVPD